MPDEWLHGYAVTADIILLLGGNNFIQVDDSLSNVATTAIATASVPWIGDKTGLTQAYKDLLALYWGYRVHSLDDDYMAQAPSVAEFRSDAVLTYQGCALLDMQVYPYNAPINLGSVVQYRTLLTNGLNEQFIIQRQMAWTSSDTTIATVDSLGNVSALALGYAWIKAAYGIKADSGMIQVVPSGGVGGNAGGGGGWCSDPNGPTDADGSRLDGNTISPTGGYCY
jgi:hypothetical protein